MLISYQSKTIYYTDILSLAIFRKLLPTLVAINLGER